MGEKEEKERLNTEYLAELHRSVLRMEETDRERKKEEEKKNRRKL